MSDEALRDWAASLNGRRLPRWQDLPLIDLYMDQVLAFLEAQLGPFILPEEKLITAAMINNYVKQGILPKPVKKKYGRPHVARLVVITLCKQVVSLTDIRRAIDLALGEQNAEQAYDTFCTQQEASLEAAGQTLLNGHGARWLLLAQAAAAATASGLAVKSLLSLWGVDK